MKGENIKVNKYYLVKHWNEKLVAKCIFKKKLTDKMYNLLFEFIKYVHGHGGGFIDDAPNGEYGHCLWVMDIFVIRELTNDEAMVESI